ncbi:MAG: filamentous hemagglutinin N-terminal domain-containing protein, partial [Helicobacter sp.]|nr:filamentous hemagglutinin N-terminal domain-containing protein [Helicobacter sp.]
MNIKSNRNSFKALCNWQWLKTFFNLFIGYALLTSANAAPPNQIIDKQRSPSISLDKTSNGVDLIHINTPNKNLQSHNVFKTFNVDKKGAILNNSNALIQSKLGGIIYANPNYSANTPLAKEILVEVSGSTKSSLLGYIEIAGGKADLILSNPNGIYLNGAGFINTHNLL